MLVPLAIGGLALGTGLTAWRQVRSRPKGLARAQGHVRGVPVQLVLAEVENGKRMRVDAARAMQLLLLAARRAGHNLWLESGHRTTLEQQVLHERYLAGTGNLAARPGYSNHEGGVSGDIGGVGGYGTPAYAWLKQNAGRFGFEDDVAGEHWHWTYTRGKR